MESISGPRTHFQCVVEGTDRKDKFRGKVKEFGTREATLHLEVWMFPFGISAERGEREARFGIIKSCWR